MSVETEDRPIEFKFFPELALNDYQAYLSLLGAQPKSTIEKPLPANAIKRPEVKPPPIHQKVQPLRTSVALQVQKRPVPATRIVLAISGRESIKQNIDTRLTIGKSKSCTAVIQKDNEVSGEHSEILYQRGVSVLCDTGSTNGTYLNGVRIVKPEPLNEGDCVTLGRTEIRIYFE